MRQINRWNLVWRIFGLRGWHLLLWPLVANIASCVPSTTVELTFDKPPEFNERIRLDRQGMGPGQAELRTHLGPFRDGEDGEIVSEIFPEVRNFNSEKLLQSDCYWASSTDPLLISWEVVVDFGDTVLAGCAGVGPGDLCGPTKVGLCRFTDPVTGSSAVLKGVDEFKDMSFSGSFSLGGVSIPLNFPSKERQRLNFDEDLSLVDLVSVRSHARSDGGDACVPRNPANPDVIPAFSGPLTTMGTFSSCATSFAFTASQDQTFDLFFPQPGAPNNIVKTLQPNIMAVNRVRTIRREMVPQANGFSWATPVLVEEFLTGPGEDRHEARRWEENFSPNVLVEVVRIYSEDERGNRYPVACDAGRCSQLRLTGAWESTTSNFETFSCDGKPEADGDLYIIHSEIDSGNDCGIGGDFEASEGVTPTYILRHLVNTVGPLIEPLRWEVEAQQSVPAEHRVFIEFELWTRGVNGALSVDAVKNFGRLQMGMTESGTVTVRNVGDSAMRIEDIELRGAQAREFSFVPVTKGRLPLPLEMRPSPSVAGVEFGLVPGYQSMESVYQLLDGVGTPALRVRPDNHQGATVQIFSYDVSFADGLPLIQTSQPRFPLQAAPGWVLPLGREIYWKEALPVDLPQGESLEIAVTAAPQHWGDRVAELWIHGYQISDPTIRPSIYSSLVVEGLSLPTPEVLPEQAIIPAGDVRNVLLENTGQTALTRNFVAITGADASSFNVVSTHSSSETIGPGGSEAFHVAYAPAVLPGFSNWHVAQLEIYTDVGVEIVPLFGRAPLSFPEAVRFEQGNWSHPVEISNISSWPVERRGLLFSGPDVGQFQLINPPSSYRQLASQDDETFWIEYRPSCTYPIPISGWREATLHVETSHGEIEVQLFGEVCR